MTVSFNTQQQKAIAEYRQKNNLGKGVSDAQVVQDMQKKGKLPSCFSSMAKSSTTKTNQASSKPSGGGSVFNSSKNTQASKTATNTKTQNAKANEQAELKALGYKNNDGAGQKIKMSSGKTYTVVGQASNGRRIVKDEKGAYQVLSHDNKLLNKDYVLKNNKDTAIRTNQKTAQKTTIELMQKQSKSAQQAFDKQMAQDGWAGDLADGISALWFSENRACKVEKDLKTYNKNITDLQKAAQKGDAAFNAKFKQIYGKDFDQKAVADYVKNPTAKNYEKAFGTKNNIQERVAKYNQSQQTGAAAVKTTAKVGAGIAIGAATVATGGAAGLAIAAAGTAASSLAIEETDRLNITKAVTKGKVEFREGTDHGKIMRDAAFDGVSVLAGGAVGKVAQVAVKGTSVGSTIARGAINVAGDVGVGAAQEYVETGEVTVGGVVSNAAMSAVGGAVVSGTLKGISKGAKFVKGKVQSFRANIDPNLTTVKLNSSAATSAAAQAAGNELPLAGGLVNGSSSSSGGFFSKLKSKLGFSNKIDPDLKTKLNANYMNDVIDAVERNDNFVVSGRVKDALDGRPLVTDIGSSSNLKNISQHVGNGEVCAVGAGKAQKLFVNDNGAAVELKLSREKFEELFPKLETATFSQPGGTQVCTIQSKINTMLDTPTGRTQIYTMLEQDGDDIIVNLRGGKAPVKFSGGKPVNINLKDNGISLMSGNAPGVEMLQQSVLVDRIRTAEDISDAIDIQDFSKAKLIKQAKTQATDASASKPLLGKAGKLKMTPSGVANVLENEYKPGQDMMTALWEGHARSIVDYNPTTRTITYHDPMKSGVDIQEPLETFLSRSPSINLNKAADIPASAAITREAVIPQAAKTTQTVDIPQTKPKNNSPGIEIVKPEITPSNTSFKSRTTNVGKGSYREVAKTADGQSIKAMISGDNFIIEKNGKITEIPLAQIRESGSIPVHETSTDSYIVLEPTKYGTISARTCKTLDDIDIPTSTSSTATSSAPSSSSSSSAAASKISSSHQTKPQTSTSSVKTQLAIPAGFRENGKVFGKRSIISPDMIVMYESNGRWKRLN